MRGHDWKEAPLRDALDVRRYECKVCGCPGQLTIDPVSVEPNWYEFYNNRRFDGLRRAEVEDCDFMSVLGTMRE